MVSEKFQARVNLTGYCDNLFLVIASDIHALFCFKKEPKCSLGIKNNSKNIW